MAIGMWPLISTFTLYYVLNYLYCFKLVIDLETKIDCIGDNKNENKTDTQNSDYDFQANTDIPIFYGELILILLNSPNVVSL